METKRILMDGDAIRRAIRRISHEILERNKGLSNAVIVGIERRGVMLAKRLQSEIEAIEGLHIECEPLNVAMYRDDRDTRPKEGEPCSIDTTEKTIILVDDVLYTGRTIRAALNALMTSGRPKSIQLAVLVDRGHRELPIRADYVGKNIPVLHPYNFGWIGCVFVIRTLTSEWLKWEQFEGKTEVAVARFVMSRLEKKTDEWDAFAKVVDAYENEKETLPPPQLAIGSYYVAGMCTSILCKISSQDRLCDFPEFNVVPVNDFFMCFPMLLGRNESLNLFVAKR